jgi:hypothetical protein
MIMNAAATNVDEPAVSPSRPSGGSRVGAVDDATQNQLMVPKIDAQRPGGTSASTREVERQPREQAATDDAKVYRLRRPSSGGGRRGSRRASDE